MFFSDYFKVKMVREWMKKVLIVITGVDEDNFYL